MGGIYAMYYTGGSGSGHALFQMKDGVIAGADVVGGILDGTYETTPSGQVEFRVTLTTPPGGTLVTGQTAGAEPLKQEISATLPDSFANGSAQEVSTPLGPVNVVFRKLREI